ncbi:MAG: hypothetical protein Q9186_001228 [Xanthomendoza sp. 1 TL-2023]
MANTSPQVLYLRLGDETQLWLFDDMFKDLCSQIDANYSTIHAKSVADAQRMLLLPSLKVILVVDGGITIGKQHMALQKQLVFAPSAVDQQQSPAVFSKHGSGWIGYIGDVNNEGASQALTMALLGKS